MRENRLISQNIEHHSGAPGRALSPMLDRPGHRPSARGPMPYLVATAMEATSIYVAMDTQNLTMNAYPSYSKADAA
jgi:hypothetical protein